MLLNRFYRGESLIYFGDTAHLPYGDKSAESIRNYSQRITEFLLEHDSKVIVIACNSASASAFDSLKGKFGKKTNTYQCYWSRCRLLKYTKFNKIVLLYKTDNQLRYLWTENKRKISLNPGYLNGYAVACSYDWGGIHFWRYKQCNYQNLSVEWITRRNSGLILGCTHYPIIKNQISKFFNFNVEVVDSARVVSMILRQTLEKTIC